MRSNPEESLRPDTPLSDRIDKERMGLIAENYLVWDGNEFVEFDEEYLRRLEAGELKSKNGWAIGGFGPKPQNAGKGVARHE